MPAILIVPSMVGVPIGLFFVMRLMTGDSMSAIFLTLLLLITVGAWFAGGDRVRT